MLLTTYSAAARDRGPGRQTGAACCSCAWVAAAAAAATAEAEECSVRVAVAWVASVEEAARRSMLPQSFESTVFCASRDAYMTVGTAVAGRLRT